MITRRSFLMRAAGTAAAGLVAASTRIARAKPKPGEADKYYRVTCQEIPSGGSKKVWLGERLVWEEPLRKVSWIAEDVPKLGATLQMERTYNSEENQIEWWRAVVTKVETIE